MAETNLTRHGPYWCWPHYARTYDRWHVVSSHTLGTQRQFPWDRGGGQPWDAAVDAAVSEHARLDAKEGW